MAPPRVGLPPCCASCAEYDGTDGVCRLLAEPSLENRRRLLTMPCDVQRLLGIRLRAQPPDVAREALLAWLDPEWDEGDVSLSYGRAPRDARLWLGSWPYLYLARTAIRRTLRENERGGPPLDEERVAAPAAPDPADGLRVARALESVRGVDAVGYAMLLDVLSDRFDAAAWGASLGVGAATITDRRYLALYRYAVAFHDVLPGVAPAEARVALHARRFTPGDPDEQAALSATRATLGRDLSLGGWRELYRAGATKSLQILAGPDALGPEAMAEVDRAFRRVLRLDVKTTRS